MRTIVANAVSEVGMMSKPTTHKRVLAAIKHFIGEYGDPPTVREIGDLVVLWPPPTLPIIS